MFLPSSFKTGICPGQGKQNWKTLTGYLSRTLFAHRQGPSPMALAVSSFLARQGCAGMRTARLCEKPVPVPCPVLTKAVSGAMGATGFEMTSSLWRGGSEASILCWGRIWVAQSRCDPQLPTCQGPPWENIHLQSFTNYLHVLHLQMGLIFFWDLRCCHSIGRRGLCWAGMAPLSQQAPAAISVFFIDRPQNTLQKKYHSLPDKEAGAGKMLCLGHRADQQQAKNKTEISCLSEQFCPLHPRASLL